MIWKDCGNFVNIFGTSDEDRRKSIPTQCRNWRRKAEKLARKSPRHPSKEKADSPPKACGERRSSSSRSRPRNDTPISQLERRAAGLFEGVRELEDASFTEGRTEDLQADREIFLRRFAAGDRDAGDA